MNKTAKGRKTVGKPHKKTLGKSVKRPAAKVAAKPVQKTPAKGPKKPSKRPLPKMATAKRGSSSVVVVERTWVVWQDGTGVHLGTPDEFRQSKRPETIVCDVLDNGSRREVSALQRAVQVAQVLRQTYANCMRPWWQYDDSVQEQRVKDWEEKLRLLNLDL